MKEINWNNFKKVFFDYYGQMPNIESSIYMLLSLFASIYLVSLIARRFIKFSNSPIVKRQLSLFVSTVINLFLLISFSIYHTKVTSFIVDNRLQGIILILILILTFLSYYLFKKSNKKIKTNTVQFTGAIEGPLNYTKFKLFLLSRVQRMKYLFLIVFIPFMILLIKPKDKILYSLVFDNSQSMENQLGFAKNVIKASE
jgi:uncharacterized membrane protein